MGHQLIEQLLDRYFEGETSLREEQQLREYFQRADVPENLRPFQPMFRYFVQEQNKASLGSEFDEKLLQKLHAPTQQARIRRLSAPAWALRIAAVVVLGFGLAWLILPQFEMQAPLEATAIDWSKYEVQDLEEAFTITQAALNKASVELNRGTAITSREMNNLRGMGRFFE